MVDRIGFPVPVLFGAGAANETGIHAKDLGMTKVFFVFDKGVKSAGIVDKILESLQTAGIEVVCFDGVLPDPPDTIINAAAEIARHEMVDGIIAAGGGSSLDAAKSVNVLMKNEPPISNYYGRGAKHEPGLPLILIPTTAGTGSEVTAVSVVSDTATQTKTGVVGPATIATLAIVDPELTLGLPPHITAFTGMDAMSHAVEAYTSRTANSIADVLAQKAISLITVNLPLAVKDGSNLEVRTNMLLASTLAGMAFSSAMVHWGHAIAHTIGAAYHVPHGVGCAIALPAAVEFVADSLPEKVKGVGIAMGLNVEGLTPLEVSKTVASALRDLNKQIGIPRLQDYNIGEDVLVGLVSGVKADVCAFFSPKATTDEDILAMLQDVYQYSN